MTKLPSLTARDAIKKLKKAGFMFDRQAKGSHEICYNPITKRRTTIPNHPGVDIPKGTLKAIIKEAGLTIEEFLAL
jgi:predicted RNA binding protein YcfA (HicA-like mRNA interferase family)